MRFPFLRWFLRGAPSAQRPLAIELPWISRDEIQHLLTTNEGLPQVDWGMAEAWIEHRIAAGTWDQSAADLRRAIAAAWLDELRDALTTDARRWRSAAVEGLAPLEGTIAPRVANAADRTIAVIGKALREIRGDPRTNPIPPIGIVTLGTLDEYYSFISHFYYEDEGEFAGSGGIYIRDSGDNFPILAIAAQAKEQVEETVAHELTHHALKPDRTDLNDGLPLWAEEGLTQMMEEHVSRRSQFVFGREMIERHRVLWDAIGIEGFISGESFHSPEDDQQELSYNLAEALTRSLLSTRRREFFAFARACRNEGLDQDAAAREHLGKSMQDLAEGFVWGAG